MERRGVCACVRVWFASIRSLSHTEEHVYMSMMIRSEVDDDNKKNEQEKEDQEK